MDMVDFVNDVDRIDDGAGAMEMASVRSSKFLCPAKRGKCVRHRIAAAIAFCCIVLGESVYLSII